MQELRRHKYFLLSHIFRRLAPRAVVLGLEAITIGPGIEHYTLLRIKFLEDLLQLRGGHRVQPPLQYDLSRFIFDVFCNV